MTPLQSLIVILITGWACAFIAGTLVRSAERIGRALGGRAA